MVILVDCSLDLIWLLRGATKHCEHLGQAAVLLVVMASSCIGFLDKNLSVDKPGMALSYKVRMPICFTTNYMYSGSF